MWNDLKNSEMLHSFLENEDAKRRIQNWFAKNAVPHAILVTAEDGCGRNAFAREIAAAYLGDTADLIVRGVHPDCLEISGEGASRDIPVRRIREISYELNLAAVVADGRRVALLRDVKALNRNAANALLKILEQPPNGVIFLLTAAHADDVIETIRSRCVVVPLLPLQLQTCIDACIKRYPSYDGATIAELCALYDGRLGLVQHALAAPERLAFTQCAMRFCRAALASDKLAMAAELECASDRESAVYRDQMRYLLFDITMYLKYLLKNDILQANHIDRIVRAVQQMLCDVEKNINLKLLATNLVAQL